MARQARRAETIFQLFLLGYIRVDYCVVLNLIRPPDNKEIQEWIPGQVLPENPGPQRRGTLLLRPLTAKPGLSYLSLTVLSLPSVCRDGVTFRGSLAWRGLSPTADRTPAIASTVSTTRTMGAVLRLFDQVGRVPGPSRSWSCGLISFGLWRCARALIRLSPTTIQSIILRPRKSGQSKEKK